MNPIHLMKLLSLTIARPDSRQRIWRAVQAVIVMVMLLSTVTGCSREAKASRHLRRAQKHLASQQLEKAEIELLNVLRLDITNAAAIQMIGIVFHDQGRIPRAYVALRKGKELNPQNLEIRRRLGFTELTARNLTAAREEALFVLAQKPGDTEAIYLLTDTATKPEEIADVRARLQPLVARDDAKEAATVALGTLLHREKNYAGAEAAFQQAITLNPRSDAAYVGLGNTYWAQTNLARADEAFKKAAEFASIRSPRRLRYAEFKLRTGDIKAAREAMLAVTRVAPDYIPPWVGLANLAYGAKDYDEAIEFCKTVLTRDSMNLEAFLIYGRANLGKNDAPKAIVGFERALTLFPNSAQFHVEMARAQMVNRDTSKAISHLNEALRLSPDYEEAALLLAELYIRGGEFNPAITLLNRLAQQKPQIVQTYALLGTAYLARGNLQEALKAYELWSLRAPSDAQPIMLIGSTLLLQGKRAEARKLFEKALTVDPEHLGSHEQLMRLDLAANQAPAALNRLLARIEKNPDSGALHAMAGLVYLEMKDHARAESYLLKSIQHQPEIRAPYIILARHYVEQKRQEEALAKLDQLLKANPKDQPALMQVASIQQAAGNMAAARDAYTRLLEINPQFVPALNNVAYINSEYFNELDKSVELAQKARDLAPGDANVADTFGWILHRRGDYPRALTLLQDAASRSPDNPEVFYHIGMTHYMMGDESRAVANLQTSVKLGKEFPSLADARRRLAFLEKDPARLDEKGAAELESQLKESPEDPVVLSRLGTYYQRQQAHAKAREVYDQILKRNPKNIPALLGLVRLYAGPLKDSKRAIELAKQARDLTPDDPQIGNSLGRLAYDSGDHKWAVSLLQESTRRTPDDPDALSDFAQALFGNGRIAEAEATAKSALSKRSEFARAGEARRLLEMVVLFRDPAAASAAAAKVNAILGAEPDYFPALAVNARIKEAGKDRAAAIAAFESLLQKYPAFTPGYRSLALLLAAADSDQAKAYSALLKARESFPEDHEVSRALGILSFKRNDFLRAASLLGERVAAAKSDGEAWLYLGLAQVKANQKTEARKSLQTALQSQPTPDVSRQAQEALSKLQ